MNGAAWAACLRTYRGGIAADAVRRLHEPAPQTTDAFLDELGTALRIVGAPGATRQPCPSFLVEHLFSFCHLKRPHGLALKSAIKNAPKSRCNSGATRQPRLQQTILLISLFSFCHRKRPHGLAVGSSRVAPQGRDAAVGVGGAISECHASTGNVSVPLGMERYVCGATEPRNG